MTVMQVTPRESYVFLDMEGMCKLKKMLLPIALVLYEYLFLLLSDCLVNRSQNANQGGIHTLQYASRLNTLLFLPACLEHVLPSLYYMYCYHKYYL